MPRYKYLNGTHVQFTAEEETQRDVDEAQWLIEKQARKDAEAQLAINRASAISKFEALGLTSDEISAITS